MDNERNSNEPPLDPRSFNSRMYEFLFSKMMNGFALHKIITDDEGKPIDYEFVEINNKFEQMTGLTREEVIGKRVREILPGTESEHAHWIERYGTVALQGTDTQFEDFSESLGKWFHVSAYSPEQGYFATIIEDITERKKLEADIANSHNLLQKIIDQLPIRIFWKDKDFRYLGANTIFAKDAGKESPTELLGKDDFQMTWKDQALLYQSDDRRVIETGEVKLNFEEPQTTPMGRIIWLRTSKLPLTDAGGEIMGILGTYEDITEQKLKESALQQKTALLEAQIDSTVDGILIVDRNQKQVLNNRRFIEIFKVPAEIVNDSDDGPLLNHICSLTKYPEQFLERVKYLYAHDQETAREEVELNNGMILDRYSAPVIGKDGKNYGRIWTFRDITERKKIERELSEKIKTMEKMNSFMVDRELRMAELKKENEELRNIHKTEKMKNE